MLEQVIEVAKNYSISPGEGIILQDSLHNKKVTVAHEKLQAFVREHESKDLRSNFSLILVLQIKTSVNRNKTWQSIKNTNKRRDTRRKRNKNKVQKNDQPLHAEIFQSAQQSRA